MPLLAICLGLWASRMGHKTVDGPSFICCPSIAWIHITKKIFVRNGPEWPELHAQLRYEIKCVTKPFLRNLLGIFIMIQRELVQRYKQPIWPSCIDVVILVGLYLYPLWNELIAAAYLIQLVCLCDWTTTATLKVQNSQNILSEFNHTVIIRSSHCGTRERIQYCISLFFCFLLWHFSLMSRNS